jgi:hypothetical protein
MSELYKGNRKFFVSDQNDLFGKPEIIGYGTDIFNIKIIPRDTANEIIIKNHYSHKFYSASYIHLGVFANNEIMGVLQFGYAMNPASQAGVVSETKQDEYLELNRMWLDDKLPRNGESLCISYAIKYIKKVYPKIKWIQSFADERCKCFGVVYQAANFQYLGEHSSVFWELDGEYYHNTLATAHNGKQGKIGDYLQANIEKAQSHNFRQFRYVYFIDKKCIKNLQFKIMPYPKREN